MNCRPALACLLFASLLAPVAADEGMWLLNAPPRERLARDHGFQLTDAWLQRVTRAAVRFNNGGSGGFVSPHGLVITNHHIGADSLQKLSTPGHDLVQLGYLAKTRDQELKCPDLELNALQSIEDVTAKVNGAVKPGMNAEQASAARRTVMSTLEKESLDKTGLRSDVVTLYQGGAYHLYLYKKYTDVRLVMAPEQGMAFFGGDTDNFEYPRYDLDICFFRIYENGQPIDSADYLPWNAEGPKEGDLVFVIGNPGRTNRLDTLARLIHMRDETLPYRLDQLRSQEALLRQYAERGAESLRQAGEDIYGVSNSRKAFAGQYQGLLDPRILERKRLQETALKRRAGADARTRASLAAWDRIAACEKKLSEFERQFYLLEYCQGVDCHLYRIARHLVRMAAELPKPSAQRMREYRDSNLDSLKQELFSPAPIETAVERVKLAGSLTFAAEQLGGDHPIVKLLSGGLPPGPRAAQLIDGSKLTDVAERKRLADGGQAAIQASQDPLIQLALAMEPKTRELRRRYDVEVDEPERQAYAQIANAMFALDGPSQAPDATFTPRLAYGIVKGYSEEGHAVPWCTTFGGAFQASADHADQFPFHLPERWTQAKSRLDLATPLDFVSTADTIGGNSGSPVVNRAGEVVGVNFDRNRYGLVRNFLYSDEQARHVAVHSKAVLVALQQLYGADDLVKELLAR